MKTKLLVLTSLIASVAWADVFKIDTKESKVLWSATKKLGEGHSGEIQVKSGEIKTDKKNTVSTANVVVDMKTIGNTDLKEKPDVEKKLIGHLSSDDFFKVEKFPESTFKLASVTPKAGSKDEYTVKGDLTMLGKTNPIEFPAKISLDKKTLKAEGKISIERLKWGLQYGSGNIFKTLTADKIINDTFDLTLNLVAKK